MAKERWIAGQPESNRDGVATARTLIERYGDVPLGPSVADSDSVPVVRVEAFTPQALEAEVERQAGRFKELGFHKRLKMSAGRFKDHLMGLVVPQPETFVGRFNIPVIGFGQIPIAEQARLVDIDFWLEGLTVSDWLQDPQGYRTPDRTYLTWMQDGRINIGKSVRDVRTGLAPDERGATVQDGIGLYVGHTEVLNDHNIDLPGTSVGSDSAAGLSQWGDRPELSSGRIEYPDSDWGSASGGRV